MSARRPRDYFRSNSALSDWLSAASPASRAAIVSEDLGRSRRLSLLHEIIGLPILDTSHFAGAQVIDNANAFREFHETARGPYAVRAVHSDNREDVLRNRNLPVDDLLRWLRGKVADIRRYDLEFSPHVTNEWAASFVVTKSGIIAEVVRGSLRQLTQGEHISSGPVRIVHNFTEWSAEPIDDRALELAKLAISYTSVESPKNRNQLREELGCNFAHETYIRGYFEAIFSSADEIRFNDFNMSIGASLEESYVELIRGQHGAVLGELRGVTASRGHVSGPAYVLAPDEDAPTKLPVGQILVCGEPTPDLIPILAQVSGVVIERGGLLTHASVVCRELKIPCLVGTTNATEVIPDGAIIDLDADAGVVWITERPGGSPDASV